MKEPKYILTLCGSQFAVPSDQGIATVIRMMEEAIPVSADLAKREITLSFSDEEVERYLRVVEILREVRIRKIPAGVKWIRQTKNGEVEIVRVVPKRAKALPAPKPLRLYGRQPARLNGAPPLQLEFGA